MNFMNSKAKIDLFHSYLYLLIWAETFDSVKVYITSLLMH